MATQPATGQQQQQPLLVLSTCPDDDTAARLARALVEERLAACVNRLPLTASTYRWQGQVVEEGEVLLLIKTVADRYPALAERLAVLHPYQVPEIIALPVADGLPGYLEWMVAQTRG
ncbi:MAG: divalent-cation tolerance protein CutA [Xanthomonadales bacterium]|nr:divalent-cation tolerance protein CutA [Xanthomonadales bacterium]